MIFASIFAILIPVINILLSLKWQKSSRAPGLILNFFAVLFIFLFLIENKDTIPERYVSNFLLYFGACCIGFFPLSLKKENDYLISKKKSLILSLVKIRFFYVASSMIALIGIVGTLGTEREIRIIGQQSGVITIFYFLSSFSKIALISLAFLAKRKDKLNYLEKLCATIIAIYYIDFILFLGKRTGIFDLLIIYFLYSNDTWSFRKILIFTTLISSMLFLSIYVGEYRQVVKYEKDFESAFLSKKDDKKIGTFFEIEHAIYLQEAESRYGDNIFNLSGIWNNIVSVIVPAQFLSNEFKTQLYLDDGRVSTTRIGYIPGIGTASFFTAELFSATNYFGPFLLFFFSLWISNLLSHKSYIAHLTYFSFIMAIPYLLNFGFFNFVYFIVRIFLIWFFFIIFSSLLTNKVVKKGNE